MAFDPAALRRQQRRPMPLWLAGLLAYTLGPVILLAVPIVLIIAYRRGR